MYNIQTLAMLSRLSAAIAYPIINFNMPVKMVH